MSKACPMAGELHWHVSKCKHGVWPQMFCKNCNGVYAESVQEDAKLESERLTSKQASPSDSLSRKEKNDE